MNINWGNLRDFNDDKPFGLVDPLGWEGDYPDPWEEYSVTGGTISNDEFTLKVPSGTVNGDANFKIDFGSFEKASNIIKSIAPSLFLAATNNLGLAITNFNNPLGLIYDYSKADLSNINEDSISFISLTLKRIFGKKYPAPWIK